MKIFLIHIKNFNTEEKGVATILTIGVLALLTALAIGFVSESILLEKISKNSLNLERARLLSQSMIQRTIAAAQEYNEMTSSALFKFYSTEDTIESDTDTLDSALSTTFNNIVYYEWDNNDPDSPRWQYIRTIRNNESDSQIIGRVAYVVINNIGKLDPSVIVDSGNNASLDTPAVSEYSTEYTGIDNTGSYITGRPGRNINEIFTINLNSSIMTEEVLDLMSANNADPAGELNSGTRWFDISEFIGAVGIGNDIEDSPHRTKFNDWFTTNNPPDPEAFWIDIDDDDIIDSQYEQFHRFNLARTDWDDITVDSFLNNSPALFSSTDPDTDGLTIPWLKNWQNAGEMGSITNCKNQIIANLIDYCDSDTDPTTDVAPPTSNGDSIPTYIGLEKCPYINEILLRFDAAINNVGGVDISTITTTASVELANMYNTSYSNLKAYIIIGIYYYWNGKTGYPASGAVVDDNVIELDFSTVTDSSYTVSSIDKDIGVDTSSGTGKEYSGRFGINHVKITLIDANTGVFYDFAEMHNNTHCASDGLFPSQSGRTYTIYYRGETNDPRENLNYTDWARARNNTNSLNSINATCNPDPGTGYDNEDGATEPWDVSTAYIRNAPIQSPWELGFIHRGTKWQTINLKAYNSTEGVTTDAGGNTYSDGDANILDQIKMTSNTETYGKANINSINAEASNYTAKKTAIADIFTSLFEDIYVNIGKSNYDNPGTQAGDPITSTIAENIAGSLYSAGTTMFKTRAEIVRQTNGITKLYNGSELTQTNDASQEEIIGKMINLTTAGNTNNLTLIAVAQVIKDVGGGVAIGGEQREHDEYIPGIDPILAEQKVLVVLIRNPITFKWQIKKLRYLNL